MAILYTNVAAVEAGSVNILANLDDPNLSCARLSLITATYTMTGAESPNDLIYIKRVPSGSLVDPTSTVAGDGIGTTASITVGDLDTQAGTVSPDLSRYSAAIAVSAAMTAPVAFAGGTTLTAPAQITDDWVFLVAKFTILSVPVEAKKLIFRIRLSQAD